MEQQLKQQLLQMTNMQKQMTQQQQQQPPPPQQPPQQQQPQINPKEMEKMQEELKTAVTQRDQFQNQLELLVQELEKSQVWQYLWT